MAKDQSLSSGRNRKTFFSMNVNRPMTGGSGSASSFLTSFVSVFACGGGLEFWLHDDRKKVIANRTRKVNSARRFICVTPQLLITISAAVIETSIAMFTLDRES